MVDLGQADPVIVQGLLEAGPNLPIVLLGVHTGLGAVIIAIEAVFQRKGVHHLELFPDDNPGGAQLARVDDEAARRQTDVPRPLGK